MKANHNVGKALWENRREHVKGSFSGRLATSQGVPHFPHLAGWPTDQRAHNGERNDEWLPTIITDRLLAAGRPQCRYGASPDPLAVSLASEHE